MNTAKNKSFGTRTVDWNNWDGGKWFITMFIRGNIEYEQQALEPSAFEHENVRVRNTPLANDTNTKGKE